LTAMSMGALVIAHSNTALGNPSLVSGENCLLASSAMEFAEHMLIAYNKPSLGSKLGASARNTYEKYFSPEIASAQLINELAIIFRHN